MPDGSDSQQLADALEQVHDDLIERWLAVQGPAAMGRSRATTEKHLRQEATDFLASLPRLLRAGTADRPEAEEWEGPRSVLTRVARKRLEEGFPLTETVAFVTAFKEPMFDLLQTALESSPEELASLLAEATVVLDRLGLHIAELYLAHRERIIDRQREELLELSTPVVKVWDGIVALPLIGTLDSGRTQVVMESLLEAIVEHSATIAILDITGVPTVDSLVAQNLMKTVAAARLMGTECILSGIRPQIAHTIVQLGLSFAELETRSSLADAIALAFRRNGWTVGRKDG